MISDLRQAPFTLAYGLLVYLLKVLSLVLLSGLVRVSRCPIEDVVVSVGVIVDVL